MTTKTTAHTDAIDWPNGEGYTPCTLEYATLMAERDAIYDANYDKGPLENKSPADYERWHSLNHKLHSMQADGHLGKPIRF